MTKWILAAGAAMLVVTAPAVADRGGGGHGDEHGQGAQGQRGGGHDEDRGAAMKVERGVDMVRGPARREEGEDRRGHGEGDSERMLRQSSREMERGRAFARDDRDFDENGDRDERGASILRRTGLVDGCPPGLAKKDNGCLPPGLAKQRLGTRLESALANRMLPSAYRDWYRDDPNVLYRYGDDYIYRVNRSSGLIDGLIPMFGSGYYNLGEQWPQPYNFYNVPYQYRSYWPDTANDYYRFGGDAIYRVNARTNLVESIVALLAGDLGVGTPLPSAYNVYNVPTAYRAQYYDTPDAWYRYNDGYIYRVDPTTRLITAVVTALTRA